MPTLKLNPKPFQPTGRYTEECKQKMDEAHPQGFLWEEERNLLHNFMCMHNEGFAWDDSERGNFCEDFFLPVEIPVVLHKPWVKKNIPIPPGILPEVCKVIKVKLDAGVYERSNSSYRWHWLCILKKDGKSLWPVHSLESLNRITIAHSGVPPVPEHIAEQFAGRPDGAMFNLYIGYDERMISESARDYTTFQTPFGALCLVTLPMGWTNLVPIFHEDITFILQDEIPKMTFPYIDDVPVKGPDLAYIDKSGKYETIPQNPCIRHFVWEHFQNINHVVQCIKYSSRTFSGHKLFLCLPEIMGLGHRCTPKDDYPRSLELQLLSIGSVVKIFPKFAHLCV
jgi:hypothetical protein